MIRILNFVVLLFPIVVQAQFSYILDQSIPVRDESGTELSMPWAGGLNAAHYNTMDLNHDDKDDLVLFDRTADKVMTFLRQDNQYVYAPDYESFFPEEITNWLLLRDFNCDGKKDIFTGDILGIKVYFNTTEPGENPSWQRFLFYSGSSGPKSQVLLTKGFSGKINLQLQFDDLPSIGDADGDGDLDIFNVRFVGNGTVEYHKNFSVERYGTCDSLDFERQTQNWGSFIECTCGTFAFNGDDCPPPTGGRVQHAGGKSLLALDADGNSTLDLLFSEASCSALSLLSNGGTVASPVISSSTRYPPPNPVDFLIYPAAFYEDVDFDGIKDLISIPNIFSKTYLESNLSQSNWFYKNSGSSVSPVLSFRKKNFLQEHMIDVGDNAVPAFIDYDGDSDYDLLISQNTSDNLVATIKVLENTGSTTSPEFRLVHNDYAGFSQLNFYNLKIQIVDVNRDTKPDLVFTGTSLMTGLTQLYYIPNQSSSGAVFTSDSVQPVDFSISASENILVTDVNKDGLVDLLVGKTTGALQYWKNTGSEGSFDFSLEDDSFLALGSTVLRQNVACAVADFDSDGRTDLVYGDQNGHLNFIGNFREAGDSPSAITDVIFNTISAVYEATNLGGRIWPTGVNLFGTTKPAVVTGNVKGGISILRHDGGESLPESPTIEIYPNPLARTNALTVRIDRPAKIQVFSIVGQALTEPVNLSGNEEYIIPFPYLSAGVYILRFTTNDKSIAKRIIIH